MNNNWTDHIDTRGCPMRATSSHHPSNGDLDVGLDSALYAGCDLHVVGACLHDALYTGGDANVVYGLAWHADRGQHVDFEKDLGVQRVFGKL